jgi:hypothetical protein
MESESPILSTNSRFLEPQPIELLESMTTADKAAAYELMLADDAVAIAKAKAIGSQMRI